MSELRAAIAQLDRAGRERWLASLTAPEFEAIRYQWAELWARPLQLAPGTPGAALDRTDWSFWLLLCGRGFGKTRSGAEWAIEKARTLPGSHGALLAPTSDDARKVMLSVGLETSTDASGILAISPPDFRPTFSPSARTLTWPNRSVATLYSAEEPDRLRGPQHHWGWADEIAAWAKAAGAWDQFLFGLRLGRQPQACVTTTPRPIPIVRNLIANERTVISRGTSYENRANLSPEFFAHITAKYEGTTIGKQELLGEVLEDHGALWTPALIEAARRGGTIPPLEVVVVGVDPAVTAHEGSDETGIVAVGVDAKGEAWVLEDRSGICSPLEWSQRAVALYHSRGAQRIVAEVNKGGDLIAATIHTHGVDIPVDEVRATKGKRVRAEPIAALYEQHRVKHAPGLEKLEKQMLEWDPEWTSDSPDRVDAMVWACTALMPWLVKSAPKARKVLPPLGSPAWTEAEAEATIERDEQEMRIRESEALDVDPWAE